MAAAWKFLPSASTMIPSSSQSRFIRSISTAAKLLQAESSTSPNSKVTTVSPKASEVVASKAMKAYLERAKKHEDFMKTQLTEYNIGKRHLANMMGKDPEFFTQEDVDEAIQYLFPSGLFDPRARPLMKHPEEVFPKQKEAEFDISGRPFHNLFYTTKANYYQLLHDAVERMRSLDAYQDKQTRLGKRVPTDNQLILSGSDWFGKDQLETTLVEKLKDSQYSDFVKTFDRLSQHPYAYLEKDFVMKYRKSLAPQTENEAIPQLMHDEAGRPFMKATGKRKRSVAEVIVRGRGQGKFTINGKDILYFEDKQQREQVIFPLEFTGLLDKVDVEANVEGGGPSGQAGAIRYGISLCLRSFVDPAVLEKMRLAGLLQIDYRTKERKKFGQEGARRKFTWKKR